MDREMLDCEASMIPPVFKLAVDQQCWVSIPSDVFCCSECEGYQVVWALRPHQGGREYCQTRETSFLPEIGTYDQTPSRQEH